MPFDPNSLRWSYTLNTASYETLGGRVVQLLSVKIDSMTWEGDAGSINRLIDVFEKINQIMLHHESTGESVKLNLPNQGWSFEVFVVSFPEMGYDNETVTFNYSLNLEVYEDYSDITTRVMSEEIDRLLIGIGHAPYWHGPQSDDYVVEQIQQNTNAPG